MRRTYYERACLAASLLALSLLWAADARIITVDDDAPADFNNIQAAINDADNGDTVEIKPGTYTGPGNYNIRFNGKPITVRGTDPEDFRVVAATVIDCNQQGRGFIFESGEDANSILSGITVINGHSYELYGAGITCEESSPVIRNCIIEGNSGVFGGGIGARFGDVSVRNCIIRRNHANRGGGIFGSGTNFTIEDCVVTANTASNEGGGIRGSGLVGLIENCVITGNTADDYGGGITWKTGCSVIANCTIAGNIAASTGGALACLQGNQSFVVNSILWGNRAPAGPEISIIFDGRNNIVSVAHSNVQGSEAQVLVGDKCTLNWGAGNIEGDPCFANPGNWDANGTPDISEDDFWVEGDYHLKSQAGRYEPNAQGWVRDDITSLCIDAGDPCAPVGPEPFPNGGRINLGGYGATAEAGKSYFGKPPCETIVAGDINGDCAIDARDFAFIGAHWLADGMIQSSGRATNPNPPDGAVGIRTDPVLSWTPGPGALIHIILLGTAPALPIYSSYWGLQTQPALNPSLSETTTYYWRVDEVGPHGIATGSVWTFTTKSGTTR